MEDRFNKIDELMVLAVKLIDEQKEMTEENKEIVSEIDHLYQRINEENAVYLDRTIISRCACVEEH